MNYLGLPQVSAKWAIIDWDHTKGDQEAGCSGVVKQEFRGFSPQDTVKGVGDNRNDAMNEIRGVIHGVDNGTIIYGSTMRGLVSKENERRSQITHITTEVEPKRKTSTIKGTLESSKSCIKRTKPEVGGTTYFLCENSQSRLTILKAISS